MVEDASSQLWDSDDGAFQPSTSAGASAAHGRARNKKTFLDSDEEFHEGPATGKKNKGKGKGKSSRPRDNSGSPVKRGKAGRTRKISSSEDEKVEEEVKKESEDGSGVKNHLVLNL